MAGFLHLVTVQNKQHFPLFLIMCQNFKKKKKKHCIFTKTD